MKIAKVTMDGYFNYGNVLQNYALNRILDRYGKTETIWLDPANLLNKCWWPRPWRWNPIKFARNPQRYINEIRKIPLETSKRSLIKSFCDRYINIRYDVDLSTVADEYDYFVVGSDQVWNPNVVESDTLYSAYFLPFARPEQRISYAASIATASLPERSKQIFIDGVRGMKSLSVREDDGARIVRELTGRKASVNLDPTLLLTAEEWRQVARRPTWLGNEPYLLTYLVTSPCPAVVSDIAAREGLKLICLPDPRVIEHYLIAPEEWLYLIDHATAMYTDSYHGTVFSIQFRTPFVVFESAQEREGKVNSSRLDTILTTCAMTDRRCTQENGFVPRRSVFTELPEANEFFASGREQACQYIERALNL